ncbi:Pyridoxal phosphate phosphatase-related [Sesbania bispinosa]|nr:Pyridoxal phosphate phosphatase-related [Sesbania bispinosa]
MEKVVVVVFDFDRTIIDDDSDRWVITEMGLTHLFNHLRSTMPWTSLMDRMMEELHSQGITTDGIAQCLKRASLHPRIVSAIKSAHALGCDLRIISDANLFYIQTILEHHGLLVIDQIRGSLPEIKRTFIYTGDGMGDYCPTLKLGGGDFVMPRKNYPLWNRICSEPKLVVAEVHGWSSGEELETILLNLINQLAM